MDFTGRNIISLKELDRREIEFIFERSDEMVPFSRGDKNTSCLCGHILADLFFEPSTRTRLSFESAIHRLGGTCLGITGPEGTSLEKGETLTDTIKMAEAYSDVIVMRHPQEGAARLAAEFCCIPVINAGDGAGQHPTQTLLDLYTIKKEKGRIDGLNVVLMGDLKFGRTAHSLSYGLALMGAKITFVAPPTLQIPLEVIHGLTAMGTKPRSIDSIEEAVGDADILYVTRIQKERFADLAEYKKVAGSYHIDLPLLEKGKEDLSVMHPLPRLTEISPQVDSTSHALYFKQAANGVPVRMAILNLVLGGEGP